MYRKPVQFPTTFRTVPKMSNDYAGLTPNIEARHMPHANYSTDPLDWLPPFARFLVRRKPRVRLYTPRRGETVPAKYYSTAHGLTQYPAPMSDGKSNTKPGADEGFCDVCDMRWTGYGTQCPVCEVTR